MIAMSGGVDSSVAAALTAQARGRDTCAGVAMSELDPLNTAT